MSKAEFCTKIAEAGKVTKKQADEIFSAFLGTITASLQKGERIALPGLGVFSVVERKAKTGRNPRTGEQIEIPARKAVRFSISSSLNTGLNGPKQAPVKPKAASKAAPAKGAAAKGAAKVAARKTTRKK
jgi:DNA-binding protein HU-beta